LVKKKFYLIIKTLELILKIFKINLGKENVLNDLFERIHRKGLQIIGMKSVYLNKM
jgi:hypothetical protein